MPTADASSNTPMQAATSTLLSSLMDELCVGLHLFWKTAEKILEPTGIELIRPPTSSFSMAENFFSLLFYYSFYRAGITPCRRTLYTASMQCQRAMVTGCDNLLDDEYKPTLNTDLPTDGYRFRSVIDIMAADRILFQVLMDAAARQEISYAQVQDAARVSLRSMARSGAQEAAEESGISEVLRPTAILATIHHFKTGILFQCPWDIPLAIEHNDHTIFTAVLEGLYHIGLGCQIIDDMVDMKSDIASSRHNYLVSLVYHGTDWREQNYLQAIRLGRDDSHSYSQFDIFAHSMQQASRDAMRLLTKGFDLLLATDDRFLLEPSVQFLITRIGAPLALFEASS